MNKFNIIFLAVITVFLTAINVNAQTAVAPAAGDGSAGDPYQIATWQNLYWLSQNSGEWGKYYLQTADIDFADASPAINTWDGGAGFTPIGNDGTKFTGTYDGDGFTITGLFIKRDTTDYVGMFGSTQNFNGVIKNLGLINVNITGRDCVGAIGGGVFTVMENCYSTGFVSGASFVGGIAGYGIKTDRSYSSATVNGNEVVGGLTGFYFDNVRNCYSTGSVSGSKYIGGIAGGGSEAMINCYSTASVSGGSVSGGLLGSHDLSYNYFGLQTPSIEYSFWNTETSGQSIISGYGNISKGSAGKTTAEMKDITMYLNAGWDFTGETANGSDDYWMMDNTGGAINSGYPFLEWQIAPAGSGTSGDPYLIANLNNLYWVTQNSSSWDKYFKQTADIDASSTTSWDSGKGFIPIGNSTTKFTGTYDGDGHTITGLFIDRSAGTYIGMFGFMADAVIKNLGMVNVNVTGNYGVGGLIGYSIAGTVSNCFSSGTVSATTVSSNPSFGNLVGGLMGWVMGANIYNCYSSAAVSGLRTVGGLAGFSINNLENCYSSGSVSGDYWVGGLVGSAGGKIINSYSTASVSSSHSAGGLVGEGGALASAIDLGPVVITNSFWDSQTSGQSSAIGYLGYGGSGGTGKTTAEMKKVSTYFSAGWDLEIETTNGTNNYWDMDNVSGSVNSGYPFLSWQNGADVSLSVSTPTVSIGAPSKSITQTDSVTFSITYSNAETISLTTTDITLNKTGTADGLLSIVDSATSNPTVTIKGITGDGTLGISISAGTSSNGFNVQDVGAGPGTTFTVDNTAPAIAINTIAGDDIINGTEDNSDVTISGTTNGAEDGQVVTVRLNGKTYNGTVNTNAWSVTVPAADAQALGASETVTADVSDLAGNAATQATKIIKYDATAPSGYSVSIDQPAINLTNKGDVSFTFANAETGATYNYTFSSSGGGTNVTGSGTITSAAQQKTGIDLSGLNDGTITLSVTLTDAAGNTGTAATNTKIKDVVPPSVVISSSETNPKNSMPFTVVIDFNEDITGFDINDIIIGNGIKNNFIEINTKRYIIEVTPASSGNVTVDIAGSVAQDAAGNGNTAAAQFSLTSTNNAPVLAPIEGTALSFSEGDAATQITNTVTVSDTDNANIASAIVQITSNYVNGEDALSYTQVGSITGSFDASSGKMTLTGSDTKAYYQAALRAVKYQNTSDNPSTAARTVSFTVNDGTANSNTLTRQVNITAVNDPPTLTVTASKPTFTEGGSAKTLFSSSSVSTVESGQKILKLILTITNVHDGASEILNIDGKDVSLTNGTSVTTTTNSMSASVNVTGTTATVTLSKTGGISTAAMQTLVDGISYKDTNSNPNTSNRFVTLTSIQDNGGTSNSGQDTTALSIASTVMVVAVDNAPTLAGIETTALNYTEGSPATQITNTVTVSDPDNADMSSAIVQITSNYISGEDKLSYTQVGSITGSFDASSGKMTLTGSDTKANYQAALRAVKYQNTSNDPSTAARTVSFTVNDGTVNSTAVTRQISITSVNAPPTLTAAADNPTFTEGGSAKGLIHKYFRINSRKRTEDNLVCFFNGY